MRKKRAVPVSGFAVTGLADDDIRRALSAQQRTAAELEAFFAALTDGILIYDKSLTVIRSNEVFRVGCGFDPVGMNVREVIRRTSCRYLDGRPNDLADQPTTPALRGETLTGRQFVINAPDGSERIYENSSVPMFLGGEVVGAVTIWHDITHLKQVEESLTVINRELEERVAERTAELTAANSMLRMEMAESAKTRATLAASEERFRALVENTSDLIWEVDKQGLYTYVSPAVRRLLGYEPSELLGKSCFDLMVKAEEDSVRSAFHSLVATASPIVNLENVNLHKDGHEVVLESTALPYFDAAGSLLGYRGVDRDITEHRRVADQILRAKNEWQATFDAIAAPIMLLDNNFRIFRANRAISEKLGISKAELIGSACYQLVHGRTSPPPGCPHVRLLADGQRHQSEIVEDRLGGWYQISVDPLFGADGTLLGSIHYGEDINTRKDDEEALRVNAARLEEAQRLAHLGHWELDIRQDRVIASEEIYRICGREPGGCFGTHESLLNLVHPDDREMVREAYVESVRSHTDYDNKHRLLLEDGSIKHVHERCMTIYDDSGNPILSRGTMQDMTGQTRLESQLRQAQKMEAIGTLAGGIAHDFNNILTAIIGFGEIVLASLPEGSDIREDQEQVVQAGNRAKELVKQILSFSRAGEQEFKPLLVQFIIKEALKLLRASLPTTINISAEIDTTVGPVLADPAQIHQVVMNLCTNAYHAMRESGGTLTVSLASVDLTSAEAGRRGNLSPGRYAVLEVSDTGPGIDKALRERIFDPYFTTKNKGEGTGLGLAVVQGIVNNLHGDISVTSALGRGASFKILLPVIKLKSQLERVPANEPIPRGDERVIVVDDDPCIVRLAREILEPLGYLVTAFVDSVEAWRVLRERPQDFDLLLTDMTMPKMTGAELVAEVLRIRAGMPIILCTGYSDLIDEEKAKSMGIKEFLLKPVEKGELARAIRRALNGKVQ